MAQRTHGRGTDYARLTKLGVLAGVALFLIGLISEYGLRAVDAMTGTLDSVFITMEFAGPVVALLSVLVFGIALPLTE